MQKDEASFDAFCAGFSAAEFDLEKLRFGLQTMLSQRQLEDINLEMQHLGEIIAVQVRGFAWAKDIGKELVRYPADWWQAFKERWFPSWALARWPVRYKVHAFDLKAVYPEFRPSLPGQVVRYRAIPKMEYEE